MSDAVAEFLRIYRDLYRVRDLDRDLESHWSPRTSVERQALVVAIHLMGDYPVFHNSDSTYAQALRGAGLTPAHLDEMEFALALLKDDA